MPIPTVAEALATARKQCNSVQESIEYRRTPQGLRADLPRIDPALAELTTAVAALIEAVDALHSKVAP